MYLRSSIRILRQCILRFLSRLFGTPFRGSLGPYLIVAPHPDDEVLGCGGLIAQTVALTGRVYIVFLTGGESSHDACCNLDRKAIKDARRGLFADAGRHLSIQVENVVFLDWGDGKIGREGHGESINNIKDLAGSIRKLRPAAVFAPHPFEGWSDHEAAERITRAAIERSGVSCKFFHYCVWFWFSMPLRKALRIDWSRARLLDIEDVYDQKRSAMDVYLKSCAPCGNPWSGRLPKEFTRAFHWKRELFFEVDLGPKGADERGGSA